MCVYVCVCVCVCVSSSPVVRGSASVCVGCRPMNSCSFWIGYCYYSIIYFKGRTITNVETCEREITEKQSPTTNLCTLSGFKGRASIAARWGEREDARAAGGTMLYHFCLMGHKMEPLLFILRADNSPYDRVLLYLLEWSHDHSLHRPGRDTRGVVCGG